MNYGPSKVVHTENYEKGRYYLCMYDKWISCDTVDRFWYFFWSFGNQVTGIENDKKKALCYTWSSNNPYYKIYGIRNDKSISKVEITLDDGSVLSQTGFYEDMFLIPWKASGNSYVKSVRGYDKAGNIIFKEIN